MTELLLPKIPPEFADAIADVVRKTVHEILYSEESTKPEPLFQTIEEFAADLNVSVRTIEREIAEGKIVPILIRGRRRFDPRLRSAYLRQIAKAPGRPTRGSRVAKRNSQRRLK